MRTWIFAALLCIGCEGRITNPFAPRPAPTPMPPMQMMPQPPEPVKPAAGAALAMRRLTVAQLKLAITQLLGPVTLSTSNLDDVIVNVSEPASYTNTAASTAGWSQVSVDGLLDLSSDAAHQVFGDATKRQALVGCTPASAADDCAKGFIEKFGRRAFRRPLEADEVQRYLTLSTSVATTLSSDGWSGLEAVVTAMLESPSFLYRVEVGAPDAEAPSRLKLSDFEIASRLAFTLTGAPPDDALLDQAAAGTLGTGDEVRTAALALLSASSSAGLLSFFDEYFNASALDGLSRNGSSVTLGGAMHQELRLVLGDLLAHDGDFRDLLVHHDTYVNAELAADYGIDGVSGNAFVKYTVPSNWERDGLLGWGAILSLNALPARSSPTLRGRFISQRLLCQQIPAPPANVNPVLPDPAHGPETMRQRLAEHTTNAACSSCHGLMDPLGLSLEHFDQLGAFRDTDQGLTLDTSGTFEGQTYDGAPGLAAALRASPKLSPCLVRQLYRFTAGGMERTEDEAMISQLAGDYDASAGSLKTAAAELISSDVFRYATAP